MTQATAQPNFTGIWEMKPEGSTFLGAAPQRIVMKIEHREPAVMQQMRSMHADGTQYRAMFRYEVDAERNNRIGEAEVRTRARWEGVELVIESRMTTVGTEICYRDYWSLSEDGRTLTMAHRDDDLAGQTVVLERASQAGTQF